MPGPISDITTTGWSVVPSGAAYAALDEAVTDLADYVACPVATPQVLVLGIDPLPAGTHSIDVTASDSSATQRLSISLLDGSGTVLGTSAAQDLTATPTEYAFSVVIAAIASRIRYQFEPALPPGYLSVDGGVLSLDGGVIGLT